jgi:hypothetical protein
LTRSYKRALVPVDIIMYQGSFANRQSDLFRYNHNATYIEILLGTVSEWPFLYYEFFWFSQIFETTVHLFSQTFGVRNEGKKKKKTHFFFTMNFPNFSPTSTVFFKISWFFPDRKKSPTFLFLWFFSFFYFILFFLVKYTPQISNSEWKSYSTSDYFRLQNFGP